MDAAVELALMAKASQVFAQPDQFLSFPALNPLTFAPPQLRFATGRLEGREDWIAYSEFSRAVNRIPRGPLYDAAADTYLWEVYKDVLDRGECAAQPPGEGDRAAYEAALALLYAPSAGAGDGAPAGGARAPSEAARRYGQYRDAVIVAEQTYKERQLSAEYGGDADLKERWRTIEEPLLRQQIALLNEQWVQQGFKHEVEAAREVERVQASRQHAATWAAWRARFNIDLDMPTDVLLNRFAGTSFTPSDLADRGDWTKLTLDGAEIAALSAAADPALRRAFSADTQASDLVSVSFETRSCGLDRPWFAKDLLQSRFWRLPAGHAPLSDGADLAQGLCPAYIAGVVFARRIEVARRPPAGGGTTPLKVRLAARHLFRLGSATIAATPAAPPPPAPAHGAAVAGVSPALTRIHAARVDGPLGAARGARGRLIRDGLRVDLRAVEGVAVTPAAPAPAPTPAPVVEPPDENITILAFICRKVPKAPDPDPGLPWPTG